MGELISNRSTNHPQNSWTNIYGHIKAKCSLSAAMIAL